nr:hypothetical protein [Providencia sp. G1(2023)]
MYTKILVPIDITEKSLAHLVMPHIQHLSEYEKSQVHFLAAFFSGYPYHSLLYNNGFWFCRKSR